MAVSALELRPRAPVALFDAAVRLVARCSGAWALAVPGGALVTGALLYLVDAHSHHQDLIVPSMLLTAAWFARGFCQVATCHYLERYLLEAKEPAAFASLKATARRLPTVLITVAFLLWFNAVATLFTLGLYTFFIGAQAVAYAIVSTGKGHPLALYGQCARALGPARSSAVWVRNLFWVQGLVILNVHIAANVLAYLGESLVGFNLTFVQRFISLDNAEWLTAVVGIGFTLFEPLRAATSTLLLIDGRVRQEGLDLVAAIDQLPLRRPPRKPLEASVGLLLALLLLLPVATTHAASPEGESTSEIQARLVQLSKHCSAKAPTPNQLDAIGQLSGHEQASLSRFLSELERLAYDDEYEDSCAQATERLHRGLSLIVQTRDALVHEGSADDARAQAKGILSRPEFVSGTVDEKGDPVVTPEVEDENGLWARFIRWLKSWLETRPKRDADPLDLSASAGGEAVANAVVILLIAGVVIVLIYLLIRGLKDKQSGGVEADVVSMSESPLSSNPMSALSRLPEGWAHLADELAARGDFREAVRSLYLALLSRLHRDGSIDYDPARSNWDYFREFKGKRDQIPPFRELTRRFDFTYYGNLEANDAGYQAFRALTQPMLASGDGMREAPHA